MATLFISDLHLEAERADIGRQFLEFLRNETDECEELYILGDLFEAWVGDDDDEALRLSETLLLVERTVVDLGEGRVVATVGESALWATRTGASLVPTTPATDDSVALGPLAWVAPKPSPATR